MTALTWNPSLTDDETITVIRAANAFIIKTHATLDEVVALRRAAIVNLRATMSQREVATAVGLSHTRIAQIEQSSRTFNPISIPTMSRADAATVSAAIRRTRKSGTC